MLSCSTYLYCPGHDILREEREEQPGGQEVTGGSEVAREPDCPESGAPGERKLRAEAGGGDQSVGPHQADQSEGRLETESFPVRVNRDCYA